MGITAVKGFLFGRWKKNIGEIDKWRDNVIPDRDYKCWVIPTYHPAYIFENDKTNLPEELFMKDISKINDYLNKDVPIYKENVKILTKSNEIKNLLSKIIKIKPNLVSFDYETTGLKPQKKGHEIVYVSLCFSNKSTYAFPLYDSVKGLWKEFLLSNTPKTCHNIKYERLWSYQFFNVKVKNMIWDSMITAHMLNNNKGVASLKFQAYKYFGVPDYDSSINNYLSAKDKGGNEINRIHKAPVKEMLKYNALDSLYGYRITKLQMKELDIIKEEQENE